MKFSVGEFEVKENKNSIHLESENHGNLIIKAVPKTENGSWDMILNDYRICSYRGETEISNDKNIFLSNIFELEKLERLYFYHEYLINSLQIEKKLIVKTDNSFKYNFNAYIIPVYFDIIFNLIKKDFLNMLADFDFEILFKKHKYIDKTDIPYPIDIPKDKTIEFIDVLFKTIDFNEGRIPLLDKFEKETGMISYKYVKYRLVSELSKFLKFEDYLVSEKRVDFLGIFTPEYIEKNIRDKKGLKIPINRVRVAIYRKNKEKLEKKNKIDPR